jgi:cell division protease FtsH
VYYVYHYKVMHTVTQFVTKRPVIGLYAQRVNRKGRVIKLKAAVDYQPVVKEPIVIQREQQKKTGRYVYDKEMLSSPTVVGDVCKTPQQCFQDKLHKGDVEIVVVDGSRKSFAYKMFDGSVARVDMDEFVSPGLIDDCIEHGVVVQYKPDKVDVGEVLKLAGTVVSNGLYWVIGGIIIYNFFNQRNGMGGGGGMGSVRNFTSVKGAMSPEKVNVKFGDVAGLDNAKLEVMEIVDFLKTPEKYAKMGAKIPKGVLLGGGPGLGKTLLAKAVAGEAGVPFFAVPASSFVELFVGVGASRVRDLFKKANENAPCIIFIDEIDAIGKSRSSGNAFGGGNDEREQTINQLLTEMDGFNGTNGIVVIAATNRPDILDPALVRPGRFDRVITLDPPTLKDREAILGIHTRGKPLETSDDVNDKVDLKELARGTVGLSGAELANICNEAAIVAARRSSDKIGMADFTSAIDRVLLGPEKKNSLISDKKKKIVAAHEAGHAIVAMKVGDYDTVSKISIVPRGKSGGVTMFEQNAENAESGLYSRKYLEDRLAVALGGRAAEEIVLGYNNITTGAYSDMEVAQQLARAMVVDYGFSDMLGPVSWGNKQNTLTSPYSNTTLLKIDNEVKKLIDKAYVRAKYIISNNSTMFNEIAQTLYEKEVLDRKSVDAIASKYTAS